MIRPLFVFGTRPEAIKLGPVIRHLRSRPGDFDVRVCVTAQHREMLDQVLGVFSISPEWDLGIMRPRQTLHQSTSRIIAGLEEIMAVETPDIVLVQGDTTTTFCAALAAFYARVPVGHVEAGLRTGDRYAPFPEEINRILTTRLATVHFAATEGAAQNLCREGVDPARVTVTGNTGIDALLHVKRELEDGRLSGLSDFRPRYSKKLIVVTAHRRESFGEGIRNICAALIRLARRGDVEVVYPVHPNPQVRSVVNELLANKPNITLLEPLGYVPFIDLMRRAYLLLTDSGGIQEEAPSLGKPVLVLREVTERPEAVDAGTALLVGTCEQTIVEESERLIEDDLAYQQMARRHNPFGDGTASSKIAEVLAVGAADLVSA